MATATNITLSSSTSYINNISSSNNSKITDMYNKKNLMFNKFEFTSFRNIIPNPLTNNEQINTLFRLSGYATDDVNGEESSRAFKNADLYIVKDINDDMYLPSIGELAIALENISYINSKITDNSNKLKSNEVFASSTLYSKEKIYSDFYSQNKNIENIWFFDNSYAMISYGGIFNNYTALPFYKYIPTIDEIEDEETYIYITDKDRIDPTYFMKSEFENNQGFESHIYDYTDLIQYPCSFMFNYRSSSKMYDIMSDDDSANLSFKDFLLKMSHEVWQLPHGKFNVTFTDKKIKRRINETGMFETDFIMIIPDFQYNNEKFKAHPAEGNSSEHQLIDLMVKINVSNKYTAGEDHSLELYPNFRVIFKDCVIFYAFDDTYPSTICFDLENFINSEEFIVNAEFYLRNTENEYDYLFSSNNFYFDIYDLTIYGNDITGRNNYAQVYFTKSNVHHTKTENKYYSTSLSVLSKNKENLNMCTYYSKYNNEGIRVNQLNTYSLWENKNIENYIYSYSYNDTQYSLDLGVKTICNFYDNGVGFNNCKTDIYGSNEMQYVFTSYFTNNQSIYTGNNDIVFSINKSLGKHNCILRTFLKTDEFGIYNDCIINSLLPELKSQDYERQIRESSNFISYAINISETDIKYYLYNVPTCGSQQKIMFFNYNELNLNLYSRYLFLINTSNTKITIALEDKSKTLTKVRRNIILKPYEIKLYYPMLYDYQYDIVIDSCGMSMTFDMYDTFYIQCRTSHAFDQTRLIQDMYNIYNQEYDTYVENLPSGENKGYAFSNTSETLSTFKSSSDYVCTINIDILIYPCRGNIVEITPKFGNCIINTGFWDDEE